MKLSDLEANVALGAVSVTGIGFIVRVALLDLLAGWFECCKRVREYRDKGGR